jgi:c-di-GMP-binding flagellar brake protein YcgR
VKRRLPEGSVCSKEMTTMLAVGDKFKSIIAGTTYAVKKIKDKMVVLETHNKKSLTKDENRSEILCPDSVYRPQVEYFKDRRKYPRVHMDLPLEYRAKNDAYAHGAMVIDASEGGFLIYSIEDIPIGTKLEIAVLFSAEYELAKFEAFAEVIRKNDNVEKGEGRYQYGLKFIQILEEDYWKLRKLLSGPFK